MKRPRAGKSPARLFHRRSAADRGHKAASRFLRMEPLEARDLLAGDYQIDLVFTPGEFTAPQEAIITDAAADWMDIVTGELPDEGGVDDLQINVSLSTFDGSGGKLAEGGVTDLRASAPYLPWQGDLQIDSDDVDQLQADGRLKTVALHEIAHAMGFGTIWENANFNLVSGSGSSDPRFTGANAKTEYAAAFGAGGIGVPIEAEGQEGTALGHWRESVLGSELMTGWFDPNDDNPLSRITVASMEDLGYTVDYGATQIDAFDTSTFASIEGMKWHDESQDGVKDLDEDPLEGWTIFLDTNQNGELDDGETHTTTAADGTYSFSGLSDGTYVVAEVLQTDWEQSAPAGNTYEETVTAGDALTGKDFGNYYTGRPSITIEDATALEGGQMEFTVRLSNTTFNTVTVDFTTSDGTAVGEANPADGDYQTTTGTVTFDPDDADPLVETITVDLNPNDDAVVEAHKDFFVELSSPSQATIADGLARGTIHDDDVPTVSFTATQPTGNEGDTLTFVATVDGTTQGVDTGVARIGNSRVTFRKQDGTAEAGEDYPAGDVPRSFDPLTTTELRFEVTTVEDNRHEPQEFFYGELVELDNAEGGTTLRKGFINDDDAEPEISIADAESPEGDSDSPVLELTVSLSNASQSPVTVEYSTADGTALDGADYTAVTGGLVTFAPDQTEQTITISLVPDEVDEEDEDFTVTLSNPTGGTLDPDATEATATILNDDDPTVSVAPDQASFDEGVGTATFTVTLSHESLEDVTVHWRTQDGTATATEDYNRVTDRTLTIAAGDLTGSLSVTLLDDELDEEDGETFSVVLFTPTNAVLDADPTGEGAIDDNDPEPMVRIDDVTVSESDGTAVFVVGLYDAAGDPATSGRDVTVTYSTADGTATADEDYTPVLGGEITIPAGQSEAEVSISIIDDTDVEPDEEFYVDLTSAENGQIDPAYDQGTGTIEDTDLPSVSVDDVTVDEDAGTATFTVTLSTEGLEDVTVHYRTANGTAVAGEDFRVVTDRAVTVPAGVLTATLDITITDDEMDEEEETFNVVLFNPTNATLDADPTGEGTINDNDDPPMVRIEDVTVSESDGTARFVVGLFDAAGESTTSGRDVTVTYSTADGTAVEDEDYTPAVGAEITIPAGQSEAQISISIIDDTDVEPDEEFYVDLTDAENGQIDPAYDRGTGTIEDTDLPTVSVDDVTVDEADGTATFTVTLSTESTEDVKVHWRTADGTAVGDDDFDIVTDQLVTVPAGDLTATFDVTILDDDLDEEDEETFSVVLFSPNGATLADAIGEGTITDNDDPPGVRIEDAVTSDGEGTVELTVGLYDAGGALTTSGRDVTVTYSTADGTALADDDYVPQLDQEVVIPAGESEATITITLVDDNEVEPDEDFTVELSGAENGTVDAAHDTATVTISDDDTVYTSNVAVPIPDDDKVVAELEITDSLVIADLNVQLDITHANNSDLDVLLISPDGTVVELFTGVGGTSQNFDVTLDDEADDPITGADPPPTGTFQPEGLLSAFDGLNAKGTWRLELTDTGAGDVGTLNSWSLAIDTDTDPATDLGQFAWLELENLNPANGDLRYSLQTLRSGFLTVQTLGLGNPATVSLTLFDANNVKLATSKVVNGQQRLEFDAPAAGTDYFLQVKGTATNVDLRLLNIIQPFDTTWFVNGTGADDVFAWDSSVPGTFTLNGVAFTFDELALSDVVFDGSGYGEDMATLVAPRDLALTMNPTFTSVPLDGLTVSSSNTDHTILRSGGGQSSVTLEGSAGDDTFEVTGVNTASGVVTSVLSGDGFTNEAVSFKTVTATAGSGGDDQATLNGTAGSDRLEADSTSATLSGTYYTFEAQSFDEVRATAGSGGTDVAVLTDSSGNDTLSAFPSLVTFSGPNFQIVAESFGVLRAFSQTGGFDQAVLRGSAGDDTFDAEGSVATFTGPGFDQKLTGFDRVDAYGRGGDGDLAFLYDSTGDDQLAGSPIEVTLSGDGFSNRVVLFPVVHGVARNGGNDTAELLGSTANDRVIGNPTYTTLTGDGYFVRARRFDEVTVHGMGNWDSAYLTGSNGNDQLDASPGQATLKGDDYSITVTEFAQMKVNAADGANDVAFLHDSTGDDEYIASPSRGYLQGFLDEAKTEPYSIAAQVFDVVHAIADGGGHDVAILSDSIGSDTLVARPTRTTLSGSGFYHAAWYFDVVQAKSDKGGNDTAQLFGSSGRDRVVSEMEYQHPTLPAFPRTRLLGTDYHIMVDRFAEVSVSTGGGHDVAYLFGSSDEDHFTGNHTTRTSSLTTNGTEVHVTGAEEVYALAAPRGTAAAQPTGDTAELRDTEGSPDELQAFGPAASASNRAALTSTDLGLMIWLSDFDEVQTRLKTGEDTAPVDPVTADWLLVRWY